MKKWNTPSITELNINETANGYFKVGYEGPFDIVLGDRNENKPVAPGHLRARIYLPEAFPMYSSAILIFYYHLSHPAGSIFHLGEDIFSHCQKTPVDSDNDGNS